MAEESEREDVLVDGDDKLARLVRDLEKSIEKAISRSPQVEECLARIRAEGYDASLVLQATLAFAPRGELKQEEVEELSGLTQKAEAHFEMNAHDRKFLRSLKIAVDDDGS
jgi:hypothetical protein